MFCSTKNSHGTNKKRIKTKKGIFMSNTLELFPYLLSNYWVFDDSRAGLREEAFVSGMTEIISRVVEHHNIPNAGEGFRMLFSHQPFEGYHAMIEKKPGGSEEMGNWYHGEICGEHMEGWLCPALYLYFSAAPNQIYMRAEPLPEGVNPIWTPGPGEHHRKFVGVPVEE
jgi:hypothetical protein